MRTQAAPTQIGVQVRWMIRHDMPAVMAIEQACEAFPWAEDEFLQVLRNRNCVGKVAEHRGEVVGFHIYELYTGGIRILKFATKPSHHRRSVGVQMLYGLKEKVTGNTFAVRRRTELVTNVRESNLAAQLFLRSQGFFAAEVIREAFGDTGEDAYRFVYSGRQRDTACTGA